ncbi:MAG: WD40 repeat domain-containing protein, partial [Vicinamibacterales bacterium]
MDHDRKTAWNSARHTPELSTWLDGLLVPRGWERTGQFPESAAFSSGPSPASAQTPVWGSLTFSPDGTMLAAAWGGRVVVWDAGSGTRIGHTRGPCAAFTADGMLVVGTAPACLVNLQSGTRVLTFDNASPATRVACGRSYVAMALDRRKRTAVFDLSTGRRIRSVDWSDGVFTARDFLLGCTHDRLRLLVPLDGQRADHSAPLPTPRATDASGVAISDSLQLVAIGMGGTIMVCVTRTCDRVCELADTPDADGHLHPEGMSSDGNVIITRGETYAVWVRTGEGQWEVRWRRSRPDAAVAVSPDGTTVAVGDRTGVVTLHDAGTGEPRISDPRLRAPVLDAAFVANDKLLLTSSGLLVDAMTGALYRDLGITIDPSHARVATGAGAGRACILTPAEFHVVQPRKGTRKKTCRKTLSFTVARPRNGIAIRGDLVVIEDRVLRLPDLQQVWAFDVDCVEQIEVSGDGKLAAIVSRRGRRVVITLCDLASGQMRWARGLPGEEVDAVRFGNGDIVLACRGNHSRRIR